MKRKSFCLLAGIVFINIIFFSCAIYPKTTFDVIAIDGPPIAPSARFELTDQFPEPIILLITRAGNCHYSYFEPTIFTKEKFGSLNIRLMSYEYEGINGIFMENRTFILPVNNYMYKNEWYLINDIKKTFFRINLMKVFENKKPGDVFLFKIFLTYSFDNNEELTQVLEYNVTVFEGKYVSPFMGW